MYRQDTCQMFSIIAGYNRGALSEEQRDTLDEWITREDFNQYLFEMFIDNTYSESLQDIINSLDSQ